MYFLNYRSAWQKLGDLSKEEAMKEFFTSLETLCPTFKIYIEAHEREKEAQERKRSVSKITTPSVHFDYENDRYR